MVFKKIVVVWARKIEIPALPMKYLPKKVQTIIKNVAHVYNTDYWLPFAAILKNIASIVGANTVLKIRQNTIPAHLWIMLVCPSDKLSAIREIFAPVEKMQAVEKKDTTRSRYCA